MAYKIIGFDSVLFNMFFIQIIFEGGLKRACREKLANMTSPK